MLEQKAQCYKFQLQHIAEYSESIKKINDSKLKIKINYELYRVQVMEIVESTAFKFLHEASKLI